ncbi:MAG: acyl-CoA thioesterase [Nitrososphaerales archaeon]
MLPPMTAEAESAGEEGLAQLVEALSLLRHGDDRFFAPSPDWWGERLFGGMVVAQALSAATQSVEAAFRPHSIHGYFFRPVVPGTDSELRIGRIRDGRSFCTREVSTVQDGKLAARMTCSFCVDEEGPEYQPPMPRDVPFPEELEIGSPPGPFESCDVGPDRAEDGCYRSSGRYWNRTSAKLADDPAIHACMLALLSDMTRTSFRPQSLDTWGSHTDTSIDHAVWFHRPARADEWLFYDLYAVVNRANRATVRGAMYTREGALVLSMVQELLIRPIPGGGVPAAWLAEKF